jgi:alkylation response protein AidB-like acyl-CoA dehydrogenase
MDFEFTEDQLDLRKAARSVLDAACPPSLVRAVHEGTGDGGGLWRTLVEHDWPAVGLPEDTGGLGLGFVEVGILVEELGRVAAPSPYLATMTQLVPALREAGTTFLLDEIASGAVTGSLALAEDGRWEPADVVATTAGKDGPTWVLDGVKTHVVDAVAATELAVLARGDAGLGMFVVPASAVHCSTPQQLDPTLPVSTVTLTRVRVQGERVLIEPGDPRAERAATRALEHATTAVALSTVATCRAIFDVTLQYVKDREQFGRPIGSFQAIKHRLAECYLAVERASALAWFAALTIAEDDDRRAPATMMAKAAAGECSQLLTRDGLQLHGGVGFTWEHDLHFLLKRAMAGNLLFGPAATHRARLARLMGLVA